MPLISKIFFALSILALIITAINEILKWLKYKKEMKAYRNVLGKLEAEEARKIRLAKEAEVIKRFHERQKEMNIEVQPEERHMSGSEKG